MKGLLENKIVVKTYGGLGNQLFQYAAGLYFSKILNSPIYIDDTFYLKKIKNNTHRKFHLNTVVNNINLLSLLEKKIFFILLKLKLDNLFFQIINDQKIEKMIATSSQKGTLYLDGYFQNFKPIISIEKNLKNTILIKKINRVIKNSISIHIRRGDYLKKENTDYFNLLDINYYLKAINKLKEYININDFKIYVFSDDIEWCKKNLKLEMNTVYMENQNELDDFYAMANCNHNIIANSTFSWWAAFLNKNQNKKVVAPKKWYNNKNKKFIFPNDWIKI